MYWLIYIYIYVIVFPCSYPQVIHRIIHRRVINGYARMRRKKAPMKGLKMKRSDVMGDDTRIVSLKIMFDNTILTL